MTGAFPASSPVLFIQMARLGPHGMGRWASRNYLLSVLELTTSTETTKRPPFHGKAVRKKSDERGRESGREGEGKREREREQPCTE